MLIHLNNGDALVIFPEGEAKIVPTYVREQGEEFLAPQEGFVMLAFLAKRKYGIDVPIVPIGVHYDGTVFPKIRVRVGSIFYLDNGLQKMDSLELKKAIDNYTTAIFDKIKQLSS